MTDTESDSHSDCDGVDLKALLAAQLEARFDDGITTSSRATNKRPRALADEGCSSVAATALAANADSEIQSELEAAVKGGCPAGNGKKKRKKNKKAQQGGSSSPTTSAAAAAAIVPVERKGAIISAAKSGGKVPAKSKQNPSAASREVVEPEPLQVDQQPRFSKADERKMRRQWLRGDISKCFSARAPGSGTSRTEIASSQTQLQARQEPPSKEVLEKEKGVEKSLFKDCVNDLRDLAYTSLSKKKKWQFANAKLEALGGKVRFNRGTIPFSVNKHEAANRKEKVKRLQRRDAALGVQTSVVGHRSRETGLRGKKEELKRKKTKREGHVELGKSVGNKVDAKQGLVLSKNYIKRLQGA